MCVCVCANVDFQLKNVECALKSCCHPCTPDDHPRCRVTRSPGSTRDETFGSPSHTRNTGSGSHIMIICVRFDSHKNRRKSANNR